MNRFVRSAAFPILVAVALAIIITILTGCGSNNPGAKQVPTYQSQNFIERQIFNHRLEISDDPSTILFCTTYPYDEPPRTYIIAGKLVSGTKRPDSPNNGADNGAIGTERADAQGMYGSSVPYRFGFTPGGVYIDFTDLATKCSTEAASTKQTSVGAVTVKNDALTESAHEAQAALKAGLVYENGKFTGYTAAAKKKAQEIIDNAVARSH